MIFSEIMTNSYSLKNKILLKYPTIIILHFQFLKKSQLLLSRLYQICTQIVLINELIIKKRTFVF